LGLARPEVQTQLGAEYLLDVTLVGSSIFRYLRNTEQLPEMSAERLDANLG
jgi:hypothetical protein